MNTQRVYFDHIVTTRLREEVLDAMMPFLTSEYGNPLSQHDFGDAPRQGIEEARAKTAGLVDADPEEIIFTSSGTESNNFAIAGVARAMGSKGNHIVTSSIEHFSVLYPLRSLEKQGFEVTYLPVDKHGCVDPDDLKKALQKETILVSIMTANNEIGTIEPTAELVAVTKEYSDACFHTDAVAAAGWMPISVSGFGVDLLSLSAHQFYGPKGAAALFLKKGTRVIPLIEGGIQEGGRRAGIENVAGIVGLGKAAEMANREIDNTTIRLRELRERLKKKIKGSVEHLYFTGHPQHRLPGHLSFCVEFIEGEAMLMLLNNAGIFAASGSTCTSRALKASHVLASLGIPPEIIQGSLVLSLGEENTEGDVDYFESIFPDIVGRLREMSPLYTRYKKTRENNNHGSV